MADGLTQTNGLQLLLSKVLGRLGAKLLGSLIGVRMKESNKRTTTTTPATANQQITRKRTKKENTKPKNNKKHH
jgi:hypothetical protein